MPTPSDDLVDQGFESSDPTVYPLHFRRERTSSDPDLLFPDDAHLMLKITGGKVYDPANEINGQIRDICIDDSGRIVSSVNGGRTIDATGMIIFPGGVESNKSFGRNYLLT